LTHKEKRSLKLTLVVFGVRDGYIYSQGTISFHWTHAPTLTVSLEIVVEVLGKIGSFEPWYAQHSPNEVHGLPKRCLILNSRKKNNHLFFYRASQAWLKRGLCFIFKNIHFECVSRCSFVYVNYCKCNWIILVLEMFDLLEVLIKYSPVLPVMSCNKWNL